MKIGKSQPSVAYKSVACEIESVYSTESTARAEIALADIRRIYPNLSGQKWACYLRPNKVNVISSNRHKMKRHI